MKRIAVVACAAWMLMGVGIAGALEGRSVGKTGEGKTFKKQTVCPVMGGAVNTNIYVDADGKRVYFCCGGCPSEFKKNPAKYIKKLEKDGVTLDKAPAADETKAQTTDAAAVPAKGHGHSAKKGGGCCGM